MELDERFSTLMKNPSYKKIAHKERKVKIDARFEKMFTDERFQTKFTMDKRGKAIHADDVESLHHFYDIDENEDVVGSDDEREAVPAEKINILEKKTQKKKKRRKKGKLLACVTGTGRAISLPRRSIGKKVDAKEEDEEPREENNEESVKSSKVVKKSSKIDFDDIRGQALPDSSDSEDDDEEINFDDVDDDDQIIHGWGEIDENVKYIDDAETSRLAVCNCDWDKIGANDLYILFDSFKPIDGTVKSVKIYPSDFGIERMQEEKVSGPKELQETAIDSDNEDGAEEGSRFHMEKLREYQLNRMKYYYAVVECNSKDTANKLYQELDGQEYEMSATRLDLRFIPDDMTFEREPKSIADGTTLLKNYEPVRYHNTALQQSTVRLTWDEVDTKRVQATMRKFTKDDIESMDFKDYLASSSSEEEDVDEGMENEPAEDDEEEITTADSAGKTDANRRIQIYKELMQEIESKEEKEKDKDVVGVSFTHDTNDDDTDKVVSFPEISMKNSSQQDDEEEEDSSDVEENGANEEEADNEEDQGFNDPFFNDTSVADKKPTKEKSRKKRKRRGKDSDDEASEGEKKMKNELELLLLDEKDTDKKHFNLKDILEQEKSKKSKRKRKKLNEVKEDNDNFKLDVSDPRFSALYSSHLYAIDPSQPNFKHTKATEAIIEESQRQRKNNLVDNISKTSDENLDTNLTGLLKSVKSKTELHKWKKEKKKLK